MNRATYFLSVLLVVILAAIPASAQINWAEHVVDPGAILCGALYVGDVNGDGDLDILGGPNSQIYYYDNNGYQAFRKINVSPFFNGVSCFTTADFDNDGDNDIVAGGSSEDHIGWWEYTPAGFNYNFLAFFNAVRSVEAVDIDNDTDFDIVATSGNIVSVFLNDGLQNFTELQLSTTVTSAYCAYPYDVDRDGDYDVVACAYSGDRVYWFEQDTVWTRYEVGVLDGAFHCRAGDVDGDNDIDVVACGYMSNTVNLFRNDGNMVFTVDTISPYVYRPRQIDIGDVDNDGDLDVAVTGYMDGMVLLYVNNGTSWGEQIVSDFYHCYNVRFGDIDSDGDLDISACSYYGNKISWFESDLTGAHPLDISFTPVLPSIVIPPGGGSFQYNAVIHNNSATETYVVDTWIDVTLPTGQIHPLFTRGNLTIVPNGGFARLATQNIPGTVMPGAYMYNGHVRDHSTWQVYFNGGFPFTKAEGLDAPNHNYGWAVFGWDDDEPCFGVPSTYALHSAYPNPFNPSTHLTFDLPESGTVTLAVYNVQGEEVALLVDGWCGAGSHNIVFDAANLPSGVYFANLTAGSFNQTQKLLLTK